jgi:DNA primase catalytic subunit
MYWGFTAMVWYGGNKMAEFTQEQIDVLVAQKIAEAKTGLFTEEDLTKRVTAEVDRRVESGIQKGLETQKQKWERELSEKANLSAEELATKAYDEKVKAVTQKEQDIKRRANKLDAKEMLTEANIPKKQYEDFITILVSDDEEVTKQNVNNFITMFTNTKNEIETNVKSQYSNIPKPDVGAKTGELSKADFNNLGYADKVKFKQTYPEIYKEFIK